MSNRYIILSEYKNKNIQDIQNNSELHFNEEEKQEFQTLLSIFDTDGNGKLSKQEAISLFNQISTCDYDKDDMVFSSELYSMIYNIKYKLGDFNLQTKELGQSIIKFSNMVLDKIHNENFENAIQQAEDIIGPEINDGRPFAEKFSFDKLKEKYPDDKFTVTYDDKDQFVTVLNKETSVKYHYNPEDEVIWVTDANDDTLYKIYENDGKLETLIDAMKGSEISITKPNDDKYTVVDDFMDSIESGDISKVEEVISKLDSFSYEDDFFINMYYNINGSYLISDIMKMENVSDKEKEHCIDMLFNKIANSTDTYIATKDLKEKLKSEFENSKDPDIIGSILNRLSDRLRAGKTTFIAPNGKIDANFYQGQEGDCWFLSSIIAIASKPAGLDILNKSLKVNKDGSVTVTLKGVGKTYTISKNELYANSQYATGDGDVRALEIALQKYFEEAGLVDIDGNDMEVAYDILTGEPDKTLYTELSNESLDRVNNPETVSTVCKNNGGVCYAKNMKGEEKEIILNHGYAIIRTDSQNVYFKNPHDSKEMLILSREEFLNSFDSITQKDILTG